MKKKVAIVLPYFGIGGAETMVSRIVSSINLDVIDVEVICIYGKPQNNRLENLVLDSGVKIKYIGKDKGFSFTAICKLWKELSAYNPDIIHTHLSACVYCAPWILCHKKKMIHTVHNTPKFELISVKKKVMYFMYKIGKAIPVAISKEIQYMVAEEYKLKNKVELIYNPVDVNKFYKVKECHQGVRLITAGRLSEQKNQRLLVDAMKYLVKDYPKLTLWILGDGPLKSELENYVHSVELDKNIHFEGNVDCVEDYFAKSDIFVLSSSYEGLPLVILEAMAAKLPIISTDVGGIKDIVSNNGILVEAGNVEKLVDSISRLIEDENLRKELGNKSYDNVKIYDSRLIAEQYVKLYEKYSKNNVEKR